MGKILYVEEKETTESFGTLFQWKNRPTRSRMGALRKDIGDENSFKEPA